MFGSKQNIAYVKKVLTDENFVVFGKNNIMFADIENLTDKKTGFCGCSYYYWVVDKKHVDTIEGIKDKSVKESVLDNFNLTLSCWGYEPENLINLYIDGSIPHPMSKEDIKKMRGEV